MVTLSVDLKAIRDVGLVIFDKDGTLIELYHYWSQMVALRARLICEALELDKTHENGLKWALGVDEKAERLRPEGPVGLKKREIVIQAAVDCLAGIGLGETRAVCSAAFDRADEESTQRLDYLRDLGVDAIWLSPIYPSPMHDFGYDVADYCDINPTFGTMADFDKLLAETHIRSVKMILDLVPNHTSSEHRWFLESRGSRDKPKRDWYIWRDPAPGGGVPNNWLSYFGGPAWEFDEKTGQYYLHLFVKQHPDLNYRNRGVVAALLNTMRFWLEKGVDGFRVDR